MVILLYMLSILCLVYAMYCTKITEVLIIFSLLLYLQFCFFLIVLYVKLFS